MDCHCNSYQTRDLSSCHPNLCPFHKANEVKHVRCTPYPPLSNGAEKRFIQSFMKASERSDSLFLQHLISFLLTYCTTPHATMLPLARCS